MAKKILLIDGTAQLYRAFYAIKPLTDPHGRFVNVVYGFAQSLLNLMEKVNPTHVMVMFDRPEPTYRHKIYPEYKAKREAAPEDLTAQIPLVKELLSAFNIPIYEQAGWEADDLIGSVAKKAEKDKFEIIIFSNDKDFYQLVNSQIKVLRPVSGGKGEHELLDSEGVRREFGVDPQQVVDVLALMGDLSDNVPGVPGIGAKTARELITAHGSLQLLFASLQAVKKAGVRKKLETYKLQAQQCRDLVTIRPHADIGLDWKACEIPREIPSAAYDLMADLGFKRLLLNQSLIPARPLASWTQGLLSSPHIDQVLQQAQEHKKIAIAQLPQGLVLAASAREVFYLPFPEAGLVGVLQEHKALADILTDPAITKIGYNLKPLAVALRRINLVWQGSYEDLHLAAHLLDLPTNRPNDFAARLLGGPPPEDKPEFLACALLVIANSLEARLKKLGADRIYREIELPLVPVLAEMEVRGIALDHKAVLKKSEHMGQDLEDLEKEIQAMAGITFNLRSPQQLAEVLFDRLGLSPGKRTKTGRSTSQEVLENLSAIHPLPQKILDYRQLQKLKSTYLDVLPSLISKNDGRLHTTFHQVGTVTGRLSSSDPNLQNIPIRTQSGRELRQMFIPGTPGYMLLSADYSQIELRILAHLSQDERMVADFAGSLDIHSATAAHIFSVPIEDVTPDMRRQAKTCNFGIAYGVSPYGLARQLRIPAYRAKEFIDGFFNRYPQVRRYLDSLIKEAREQGFVCTFLGRRRYLPDIHSANRTIREAAERMAINNPIQGSAADIIKRAMIEIARELEKGAWKSRMILQVHDELLFEGPAEEMPGLKQLVTRCMAQVYPLRVGLVVEVAWGSNWMEAHV